MKKVLPLLLVIFLFQSCKIYDSRLVSKESALLYGGKVKVKSTQKTSYKFDKLIEEENQLYGVGKRQSGKSKLLYTKNIVNQNKNDKYVKILLTDDLVNEIHVFSKIKSDIVKDVGWGVGITIIVVALSVGLIALILTSVGF